MTLLLYCYTQTYVNVFTILGKCISSLPSNTIHLDTTATTCLALKHGFKVPKGVWLGLSIADLGTE